MLSQQAATEGRAPASNGSNVELESHKKILDLIGEL
jgi:hypothetical protein